MTDLHRKHKQIYSLSVKEVDPQVNWAALVEEKLVWAWLQLGGGLCVHRGPHRLTDTTVLPGEGGESCVLDFPDVSVDEKSRLREVCHIAEGHTAEVETGTLLGSPRNPQLVGVLAG